VHHVSFTIVIYYDAWSTKHLVYLYHVSCHYPSHYFSTQPVPECIIVPSTIFLFPLQITIRDDNCISKTSTNIIFWGTAIIEPRPPIFFRFRDHTHKLATISTTPLDEGSAHRRDLHLITPNNHKIQTSMTPAGFEPVISTSERPKNHAVDRAVSRIGSNIIRQIT
jgi:hypothetical protein